VTHQTPLGFADEMRVGLRGMVRRVWGRRGVKVRQRLQLVYKWRYLFLAVDVEKGKVYWSWIDSMKAEMVGAAVNGLKQQTDVAAVVWDGAPSHRDQRVHGLGLPLIGLPPYSTELNPAERIFEEVRRWIEGKVYSSIEDKVEAVEAFLTKLESDPDRVRTLCGWHWIKEAI
jgi:transposase